MGNKLQKGKLIHTIRHTRLKELINIIFGEYPGETEERSQERELFGFGRGNIQEKCRTIVLQKQVLLDIGTIRKENKGHAGDISEHHHER